MQKWKHYYIVGYITCFIIIWQRNGVKDIDLIYIDIDSFATLRKKKDDFYNYVNGTLKNGKNISKSRKKTIRTFKSFKI